MVGLAATFALAGNARAADPLCTGTYGGPPPRAGAPLRFGVDPGIAGSAGGVQLPSTPDDPARDLAAMRSLRPPGRILVARLNRLFWSDGETGIAKFKALVSQYTRAGIDTELQVRYHPAAGQAGNLSAWVSYVRHVVDVFGANPRVVAMTITNEVNLTFSPNTSDGYYAHARDALIDGIDAAHAEAVRRGYRQLRFGFTYAYRFSPSDDASFFAYLGAHGGAAFRAALGFVGLDFYPGSIYPPAMAPGDTYRGDTAQALGTVRRCFMGLAAIGAGVPIWVTENGVPTGSTTTDAQQASALSQLVHAVADYSGTFNVTDYRWFNLRDSSSEPVGSLPGAAATFATDGLLRDDYGRKPAFATLRTLIAGLGRRETAAACHPPALLVRLPRYRARIRRAALYLGGRRVAAKRGRSLHSITLAHPPSHAFRTRVTMRLSDGTLRSRALRFAVTGCRVVRAVR